MIFRFHLNLKSPIFNDVGELFLSLQSSFNGKEYVNPGMEKPVIIDPEHL